MKRKGEAMAVEQPRISFRRRKSRRGHLSKDSTVEACAITNEEQLVKKLNEERNSILSCIPAIAPLAEAAMSTNSYSATSLSNPELLASAIKHLKESDPKLRAIIELHTSPVFTKCESSFRSLVQSIVFQQLATKAANAIFDRLASLCGGKEGITPAVLSARSVVELRKIGISERKAVYLHDLAYKFISGGLSDSTIHLKDDGELMSALTAVKGIGVWSVHMFMIFALHRPDVLPVGDLGVRKGFQKLYNLKSLPTPAQMEEIASCWRPYRSLGSWYMWRLMEKKVEDSSTNSLMDKR